MFRIPPPSQPRQGTEDHPQIAQDSREDESLDIEPSGPGEPAEQDVVAESETGTPGEDRVESLAENGSLLSSDREEEPQPDEQPAAKRSKNQKTPIAPKRLPASRQWRKHRLPP